MIPHDDSTQPFLPVNANVSIRPQKLGRYLVLSPLGSGGMSSVFLASDPLLKREVAVKVLNINNSEETAKVRHGDSSDDTLLEEARRLANLNVEGLVRVLDCGSDWVEFDSALVEVDFMVYQVIRGLTLQQWAAQSNPDLKTLVRKIVALTETLGELHRLGIYHRDVKPANVMIDDQGQTILIDFGLAISVDDEIEPQMGRIVGTLPYMSPEQVAGRIEQIDGRSDLYSLGASMYELLTGKLPFAISPQTSTGRLRLLRDIQHRLPQPPRQIVPEIPQDLEDIVLRLLSKMREDRFRTAADLLEALQVYLGERPPRAEESERYLLLIQSHDAGWVETEQQCAANYFQSLPRPIPSSMERAIIELNGLAATDANTWRRIVTRSIQALRAAKQRSETTHLVPRLMTLCAFALGVEMNHQHNCQLYHTQNGSLIPLWRMDRSTNNAPIANSTGSAEPTFFVQQVVQPSPRLDIQTDNQRSESEKAECLAIQVGANPILKDVKRWRDANLSSGAISCLTRANNELSPLEPRAWIQAASEIRHAIKSSEAADLYLFMDGPASLALMVGDALGPWAGKRIHLMQFQPCVGMSNDAYIEVLVLPDDEIQSPSALNSQQRKSYTEVEKT